MNGWMIYVLASHVFSTLVHIAMIGKPRKAITNRDAVFAFLSLSVVVLLAVPAVTA